LKINLDLALKFLYNMYSEKRNWESGKTSTEGKPMETQYEILYFIFLLASIHITWTLGKRQGIVDTLDYLEEKGDIELDED